MRHAPSIAVQSHDDVQEIAQAFGLGDGAMLTGASARGEQGAVVQVATSRGTWAVKASFAEPDALDGEDADFQSAARAAGVPAPAVVHTVGGDVWARLGSKWIRVYEWVDLLAPNRALDPAEVGRLLAAIHMVEFEGARPEDPWYTDAVGAAAWDELIQDLADGGAPFAADVAAMRSELVALESLLEPASSVRTCHRDLWADNVRRTSAGGLCVIDWENCGLAAPGQELAVVLFEFGSSDEDRTRELFCEYRRCGGPGRVRRRGDFSMAIAQLGHITELSCRSWLDPAAPDAERDRQAARFRESAEDPLTVERIDQMLDAVGGE
ncbi:MAG TPA: phosphotransferase [Gaiellales bacterium]|nr:phosphotransferase [Gaiellales bacterium]